MELLPIFLNIRGRKCIVVGGGEVALRKSSLLVRAGGSVQLVAPEFNADLEKMGADGEVELLREKFREEHLNNAVLVVAGTDDLEVNRAVSDAAHALDLPVNVVDQPDLCSFIMPAIVDRSPIVIAISSGGSSPVLTRHLKELNEVAVPGRINNLAKLLRNYRKAVKSKVSDFADRIRFWESVLDSDVPELVYSGQDDAADSRLQSQLDNWQGSATIASRGEVYLVGAGPGDPDLLTLRALRLMHKAEVVLYDRLVSAEIMKKVRPDAEKIHVGKEPKHHPVPQESINALLVKYAQEGKRVLRLKGGDPFIFGRGGEELAELAEAGIPFQVVPGITAASGVAAYCGIPLTHRDHAQSVRFLTGHMKNNQLDIDWKSVIAEQQTLVFYMGLVGLPTICEQLVKHGFRASTPVAVVQQGTTANQKIVIGTVEDISERVAAAELQAPTLIIIGDVVKLHDTLNWYQQASH